MYHPESNVSSSFIEPYLPILNAIPDSVQALVPEASSRKYYRLFFKEDTKILCTDPNFQGENSDFFLIQKLYKKENLPVPEIYSYSKDLKAYLISDSGELDLSFIKDKKKKDKYLKKSIDLILSIQKLPKEKPASSRSFDFTKLSFEVNMTFLKYEAFHIDYPDFPDVNIELRAFFENLCYILASFSEKVLCHRDYHSRNLLINKKEQLGIIDFQDTMLGTPFYDLSSLLYDAYNPLSHEEREEYYQYFISRFKEKKGVRKIYMEQALQRSFKALGSYFFLFHEKRIFKYKESLIPCVNNLLEICQKGFFPDSLFLFLSNLRSSLESL